MSRILLFLGILLCFLPSAFSQELPDVVMVGETDHKHLKETNDNYFLNAIRRMEIIYIPSQRFVNTDYGQLCLPTSRIFTCFSEGNWSFSCSYPFLTSQDEEMIIFSNFRFDNSIKKQEEQIKKLLKDNFQYLGKDVKNWEKLVSFYPKKTAKKQFNTDMVFRYTIPIFPEDVINRNGKEFKYAEKFFIWNKKVGFIDLTCFYTEKAKQSFNEYWNEVEKMFEYRGK